MSGEESAPRQRKPTENNGSAEAAEPSACVSNDGSTSSKLDSDNPKNGATNLYSKFVDSLERSLAAVVSGDVEPRPVLSSLSIEGVAEFIKKQRPKNVIVMSGAGISTSAGVPDFRTPGTGLYDNLQEYDLEEPQDIFDLDFFKQNPKPFFALSKELFPKHIKPTPCHYFVRLLEKKGLLRRWFTQNIDSLEYKTGINAEKVVAAHGSHQTNTCLKCKAIYDLAWITRILEDKSQLVAYCEKRDCGGVVKPDIVFFGENLPKRFFSCLCKDFPNCDLLIIMGTSLQVQPFAGLVEEVGSTVPRLLINMEAAGQWGMVGRGTPLGLCYGDKRNKRDVFWKGTCDEGCEKLADLLGWGEELEKMILEGPPTTDLL